MIDSATMKAALLEYIDAYNATDTARLVALYAENASVEDPVGTPVLEGRAAIQAFYARATQFGGRLELAAPPRGSHGNAATVSFVVKVEVDGRPVRINVTDVMRFDADGKFASMQAFWGPDDMLRT